MSEIDSNTPRDQLIAMIEALRLSEQKSVTDKKQLAQECERLGVEVKRLNPLAESFEQLKANNRKRGQRRRSATAKLMETEVVEDSDVENLMRDGDGVFNRLHTLASAKMLLRKRNIRHREVRVRVRPIVSYNSGYELRVDELTLKTAYDGGLVEWDPEGVISFDDSYECTEGEALWEWSCLLYETGIEAQQFWIQPVIGADCPLVGWSEQKTAKLIARFRVPELFSSDPITELSAKVSSVASQSLEEAHEDIYYTSRNNIEGYEVGVCHDALKGLLKGSGLFDKDMLYDGLYDNETAEGSRDVESFFYARERNRLESSPAEMSINDPRQIWHELRWQKEALEERSDAGHDSDADEDRIELLSDLERLLSVALEMRLSMQRLAWVAYLAGQERARLEFEDKHAELMRKARKFDERTEGDGKVRTEFTRVVRNILYDHHQQSGAYLSPKKFLEHVETSLTPGSRKLYDEALAGHRTHTKSEVDVTGVAKSQAAVLRKLGKNK